MRLDRLQRWMQAVVVHPGATPQALKSSAASSLLRPSQLESVLLPSRSLSAAERIAIYQEMYPYRMRDALSSDYPGVEHFLGDDFWDFVVAYTKAHPSMSHSLNRLGDRLPDFVGRQTRFKPRPFLKDLARLEVAITESFDSKEAGTLKAGEIEGLSPAQLLTSRLITVPSLRLIALAWNAPEYLNTIRDDQHNHPKPKKRPSFVVVVRKNYSVYRFPVSEAAFQVLLDLKKALPIGAVVERALARRGARRAAPEEFSEWFRSWTADGLFSGVQRAARKGNRK